MSYNSQAYHTADGAHAEVSRIITEGLLHADLPSGA
jgi:hypothetical protein